MKIILTESQFNKLKDNRVNFFPNLENIEENKKNGLILLINEAKSFKTSEELLRNGGFSTFALDMAAYGFTEESIKQLPTKVLKIKWKDDLENVYYGVKKSGLTQKEWSKKVNLNEPVDVSFDGKHFILEDGHHRYLAAKILGELLNVKLEIKSNPIIKLSDKGYDDFHREFFDNNTLNEDTHEDNHKDYLKWKRKNVTIRGVMNMGEENNGGAMLGRGLYTAFLSNKMLAKKYGKIYFVLNAIPKHPKVFNTLNDWEIWFYNTLVYKFSKEQGKDFPDKRDFNANTTIEGEMMKLGYDGIVIKGREAVNFTPGDDVMYFENEVQLKQHYNNEQR